MTDVSRRTLLTGLLAGLGAAACTDGSTDGARPGTDGATTTTAATTPGLPASAPPELPPYRPVAAFPEGILSGWPLPDSVLLWTRVSPEVAGDGVEVTAELATTADFAEVLLTRPARATAETDHCVHVDVDGLEPDSWYFYRFRAGDETSPVGRTRTAPAPGTDAPAARVAFFSCQRYTHGWYTSHRHLAGERDLDLVISLGDYVYDDSAADGITVEGRLDPTAKAVDRATYRAKYALYRSDPDLQAMHAAAPLICIPDNHDGRDGPWQDPVRVEGAIETFFERMPVRRDPDEPGRLHQSFRWGRLFELWMLDCRQYRTRTGEKTFDSATDRDAWDPARTILGADQKAWLKEGLVASDARWRIIGSSLMFSPTRLADGDDIATRTPEDVPNGGLYVNGGQWDGYQVERREILQHLVDNDVTDTIVISGDMHWFAAGDGQLDVDDPASPRVYAEFVGGSVTSAAAERFPLPSGGAVTPAILGLVRAANSQLIRFFDVDRHGHGELRLGADAVDVDFVSPTTIAAPDAPVEVLASFRLAAGGAPMEVTRGAQW